MKKTHLETFNMMSVDPLWHGFTDKELQKVRAFMNRWELKPGNTVLEPGCGTGRLTRKLGKIVGPSGKVIACDNAHEMIVQASMRVFPDSVDLRHATTLDLDIPEQALDAIICFNVLPHLVPMGEHFTAFRKWLKSNGALWICHTASRDFINGIHREAGMHDHLLPDPEALSRLLKDARFDVLDIEDGKDHFLCQACLSPCS